MTQSPEQARTKIKVSSTNVYDKLEKTPLNICHEEKKNASWPNCTYNHQHLPAKRSLVLSFEVNATEKSLYGSVFFLQDSWKSPLSTRFTLVEAWKLVCRFLFLVAPRHIKHSDIEQITGVCFENSCFSLTSTTAKHFSTDCWVGWELVAAASPKVFIFTHKSKLIFFRTLFDSNFIRVCLIWSTRLTKWISWKK